MTYSEKLKDPRWQKKRLEILQRDEFMCQLCQDTESTLVIHHYKYSGEPWEVEDKYLMTLCESCHESEHKNMKACKEMLLNEMMGLDSYLYHLTAHIIHLLKNSGYPNDVSFNILETCLSDENFIKDCVMKRFLEIKGKDKVI